MKIEIDEKEHIVLKDVFSGVLLETTEGNQIAVCARDDTFEVNILPKGVSGHCWQRVNMQTREIIAVDNQPKACPKCGGRDALCKFCSTATTYLSKFDNGPGRKKMNRR